MRLNLRQLFLVDDYFSSAVFSPPSAGAAWAQCAEKGLLIRRALDLMGALKLGVHIDLDEIRADEFCAMLIIAEERDLLEREKTSPLGKNPPTWR